jgi:hypothetical protein
MSLVIDHDKAVNNKVKNYLVLFQKDDLDGMLAAHLFKISRPTSIDGVIGNAPTFTFVAIAPGDPLPDLTGKEVVSLGASFSCSELEEKLPTAVSATFFMNVDTWMIGKDNREELKKLCAETYFIASVEAMLKMVLGYYVRKSHQWCILPTVAMILKAMTGGGMKIRGNALAILAALENTTAVKNNDVPELEKLLTKRDVTALIGQGRKLAKMAIAAAK